MARKASSADPHYHMIPTVFSQPVEMIPTVFSQRVEMIPTVFSRRVEMIPNVFCDGDFGNSGPQTQNIRDPRNLQFTQESIKDSFSKAHNGVKLEDTVSDIKGGRTDFSPLGPLKVHEGDDGRLWCENNRRLWVARQAGVPAVEVKMKSNDFISRRLGEETREKLSDPEFFPKVRSSRP